MKNPKTKMWLETVAISVLVALVLFISARTIDYWQAWAYLGVSAVSSVLLVLFISKDPILLENRTRAGPTAEQRTIQKIIVLCAGLPAIAPFIVPGLDRRFGWSNVPSWISIPGNILIIVAMSMVFRVFKENSFGSATVEVTKGQKSDLRPLCDCALPDVRERGSIFHWNVLCARLLLGAHRLRPHDPRSGGAAF